MQVAALMGSASDKPKVAPAVETIGSFDVPVTEHVMPAVDGAANAALPAVEILALHDAGLADGLAEHRAAWLEG